MHRRFIHWVTAAALLLPTSSFVAWGSVFDGCYADTAEIGCDFRGAAKCEKLYEGDGKNLVWSNVRASGGDKMAEDAARLSQSCR